MRQPFKNRREAGTELAQFLLNLKESPNLLVLALPRGGVAVGYEVAHALGAPLDILAVRKLGSPGQAELAMGAIAGGGTLVLNKPVIRKLEITDDFIEEERRCEQKELERRERLYREGRPPLSIDGKYIILVDDGLATGSSMRVAIEAARRQGASQVVVGIPVGAAETVEDLKKLKPVAEVRCLFCPEVFHAVGVWYDDFSQVSDEEVKYLLRKAIAESD